ncbi:MAG: sugar ABC transporter permease, partial [Ardenticatenia bacterium]|nr:sugar ABC transporter permease [Ardenticatenia bacterium]
MATTVGSQTQLPLPRRSLFAQRRSESAMAWVFSAPAIILLVVFLLIPFLMAIGLA